MSSIALQFPSRWYPADVGLEVETGSTRHEAASAQPRAESELQALYETLSDIAGLMAPEKVLQAITARARSALGADLAYFSLLDPGGEGHLARISAGRNHEWLHDDVVKLGGDEGVAGRVAERREVFSTTDYLNDPVFHHDPTIDEVVEREGLVSIAGAPLLDGDHLFGVLLVAHRARHEFTAKELVFLRVIAGHAAVALARAQLVGDLERQNTELAEALQAVRTQAASIDAAQRQHEELTALVLAGVEAREVVRRLGEIIGTDVTYVEQDEVDRGSASGIAVDVRAGARRFGWLVLEGVSSIDDQQSVVLTRGANVVALSRLLEVSILDSDSRSRVDLLTDLLSGRIALQAAENRVAATIGRAWGSATSVVSAIAEGARSDVEAAARAIALRWDGLFLTDHQRAFVVAPGAHAERLAHELLDELRDRDVSAYVGHAHAASGLESVTGLHAEAIQVAEALQSLQSDLRVSSSAQLGIVGLVLGARQDGAASLIERALGPVLEYDAKHRTDLERTMRAYFATGAVLAETARELHVHPKTVSQRVARIKELLGPTALEGDRAMELFIALRLRSILGTQRRG